MLHHPTIDHLRELGLVGMARVLEEMRRQPDSATLDFEERLAQMVYRERLERDTKRLHTRLRFAGLRVQATPEDVRRGVHRHCARPAKGFAEKSSVRDPNEWSKNDLPPQGWQR